MDFKDFYEYCELVFEKNSTLPALSQESAQKLFDLTSIMLEVNKSMNLTAIKDENAIILRHYADSLMISQYIPEGANIIDVGCGAGFPTLPLAIFRPDLSITALDSTAKRIDYVNKTANQLGLKNVKGIAARAEDLANDKNFREKFDIATARAVAALPILSELCIPFVKLGGKFVAMKGQKGDDELSASFNAISKCGGKLIFHDQTPLIVPDGSQESRSIFVIGKESSTPKEFPRHYSKISKKPL